MIRFSAARPGASRAPKVLVAEDDAAASDLLRRLLERAGCEVAVAPDGAAALRLLEEEPPPDALLLDWMLPEVSGVDVCRQVRQRWDAAALPILMLTARNDAASISTAFAAGASDYLTKPFLAAELRARVASHLHIKQLMEERQQMDEQLRVRETLSALGLLVGGVAHDLNNPLGGIAASTQLLLQEEEDAQRVATLERILGEVQRCNRIVGDLLAFARRRPPERTSVRVAEVLRSTLNLRLQSLQSMAIPVQVELAPDLPSVSGEEHQLQQVFLNILINAEHALRQGGSRLRVSADVAPPSTWRDPAVDWLVVSFFNDGPPIPTEVLPRIFDPLFTTRAAGEGTGLGLAICQRIVREHGGEVEVETGTGGTTFRIFFPAAQEAARPCPHSARAFGDPS